MVFVVIAVLTFGFGYLLHGMAKRRGLNPIFWGLMGGCFWFFPIPILLFVRFRAPGGTSGVAP